MKTQPIEQDAVWNDKDFRHAYLVRNKVWLGGPALCGYSGNGPITYSSEIPAGACPICAALVKYEKGRK